MRKELFEELKASIREAGKIRRGEIPPSRAFEIPPEDIQEIRRKLGKSQSEFAFMIGVSVGTLRNWEQGRRHPDGPARALLTVAASNPQAVSDALEGKKRAA